MFASIFLWCLVIKFADSFVLKNCFSHTKSNLCVSRPTIVDDLRSQKPYAGMIGSALGNAFEMKVREILTVHGYRNPFVVKDVDFIASKDYEYDAIGVGSYDN